MATAYLKWTPLTYQASNRRVYKRLRSHERLAHISHRCMWLLGIQWDQMQVQIKCSPWKCATLRWHCIEGTTQWLTAHWLPSLHVCAPKNLIKTKEEIGKIENINSHFKSNFMATKCWVINRKHCSLTVTFDYILKKASFDLFDLNDSVTIAVYLPVYYSSTV